MRCVPHNGDVEQSGREGASVEANPFLDELVGSGARSKQDMHVHRRSRRSLQWTRAGGAIISDEMCKAVRRATAEQLKHDRRGTVNTKHMKAE